MSSKILPPLGHHIDLFSLMSNRISVDIAPKAVLQIKAPIEPVVALTVDKFSTMLDSPPGPSSFRPLTPCSIS